MQKRGKREDEGRNCQARNIKNYQQTTREKAQSRFPLTALEGITCWHLDVRPPASRTVRWYLQLFDFDACDSIPSKLTHLFILLCQSLTLLPFKLYSNPEIVPWFPNLTQWSIRAPLEMVEGQDQAGECLLGRTRALLCFEQSRWAYRFLPHSLVRGASASNSSSTEPATLTWYLVSKVVYIVHECFTPTDTNAHTHTFPELLKSSLFDPFSKSVFRTIQWKCTRII